MNVDQGFEPSPFYYSNVGVDLHVPWTYADVKALSQLEVRRQVPCARMSRHGMTDSCAGQITVFNYARLRMQPKVSHPVKPAINRLSAINR